MDYLLCVESGTSTCSVALSKGLEVISVVEVHDQGNNHAKTLTVFVQKVLQDSGLTANDLSAVVVSKGPGSYTGLRIGVSVAKGICYAVSKPLIAIGSLESMTYGAMEWVKENPNFATPEIFCPMIDARRLEVYTQLFDSNVNSLSPIEAKILDENSFSDILDNKRIVFFGNGSAKAKPIITHTNALFIDNFSPSARFMIPLAVERLKEKKYEDTAYFEPLYLKEFVAIKSTKNIFG